MIAHDTRHHSAEFAELCARVLAAAGFRVFLVSEPRSTPLLSTAVRHLQCDAGIMITASHNPPSDNGFKCYGCSGGQVVPPDDRGIIDCVKEASDREIPEKPLAEAIADGSVERVGPELDTVYLGAVLSESVCHARDLSIVYTPLHGVGKARSRECSRRPASPGLKSWPRSALPTVISRTSPVTFPIRNIPGRSKRRSGKPGKSARTWFWRAILTPIASASAFP